jgi:hypothetical protein
MAHLRCARHPPGTPYGAFVQPVRQLACPHEGCGGQAVLWLDPEEVREHAWGSRVFFESLTLIRFRVDERGLESLGAPSPRLRGVSAIHGHGPRR